MAWLRFLTAALSILATGALAQQPRNANTVLQELHKLAWQRGPGDALIADKAKLTIPSGFAFLDERNTRRFLGLFGQRPVGAQYMITNAKLDWFLLFSFAAVG